MKIFKFFIFANFDKKRNLRFLIVVVFVKAGLS